MIKQELDDDHVTTASTSSSATQLDKDAAADVGSPSHAGGDDDADAGDVHSDLLSGVGSAGRRKDGDQMSVTLKLNSNSSENIGGVIAAIADLLKIAVPPSYELSRSPSPPPVTHRPPPASIVAAAAASSTQFFSTVTRSSEKCEYRLVSD